MRKKVLAIIVAALTMATTLSPAQADVSAPAATESPSASATPSASEAKATTTPAPLTAAQAIYVTPGYHLVNGRYWFTQCEMYSSTTVRCRTSIYGTKIYQANGQWYTQNTWVHNNLTYLPSPRAAWKDNNLGKTGSWTAADGRMWKTECDTASTGKGACRSYNMATVASLSNGQVTQKTDWVFNGIVQFETASAPWVKAIPATAPMPAGVPSATTPRPIVTPSTTQNSFKLDSRCLTGRAFCISKSQRKMAWVVDGKVDTVVDVRFGSELTPTRNGAFKINFKSRNHVSSLYHTSMPYAMFFSGGQAIHYSADFAARGYNGASHGCVNVRNKTAIARLFDLARTGDKVIVYN